MIFTECFNLFFSLGLYNRLSREKQQHFQGNIVAAGNPEKISNIKPSECDFPIEFMYKDQCYNLKDYHTYRVSGNSMSPEGIYSGDSLLAQQSKYSEIVSGDFIVIKVDHDFYKMRHQDYEPRHPFKLRKAIGIVTFEMTKEQVCAMLAEKYEELVLPEYNKAILDNLNEARKYYKQETLYASITYPDGKMHISFHAASLISDKVLIVGRIENGELRFFSPDELAEN